MTGETNHLFSRELIQLTGIRSKQVAPLFAQVSRLQELSHTECARKRWNLRRDLSRVRWLYQDRLDEAARLPNPSESKKQRSRAAKLGEKLLAEMRTVADWSFLRPAAIAHLQMWAEERNQIRKELLSLTRGQQELIRLKAYPAETSSKFLLKEKQLQEKVQFIDQKILRLELQSEAASEGSVFESCAPELLVDETVSALEILVSLLSNHVPDEQDEQKNRAAAATRWLAENLREIAEKYVNTRSPTIKADGEPGRALRFASDAAEIVGRSFHFNHLRDFWLEQDRRAKEPDQGNFGQK